MKRPTGFVRLHSRKSCGCHGTAVPCDFRKLLYYFVVLLTGCSRLKRLPEMVIMKRSLPLQSLALRSFVRTWESSLPAMTIAFGRSCSSSYIILPYGFFYFLWYLLPIFPIFMGSICCSSFTSLSLNAKSL